MAITFALPAPTPDDQPQAAPGQPAAAPPAAAQAQPYKPSLMDILQGVLFNGQSPAEAAMAARGRQYQLQQQSAMMDALKSLPPDQRLAMLLAPGKYGEALASHVQDMALKGGETRNGGIGGPSFTAPLLSIDDKSGKPTMLTANGPTSWPSLGGDFSPKDGLIASGRTGGVAGTYSLPQIMAPGAVPNTFTPQVSGSRAGPAQPSASGSSPAAAGSGLDPIAFFKSFVLPHEGGLNPRDLNGSPTKYGINQAANPGVDITKITPDDAASIFANKYFANSGAAHLPPALAAVHADTSFINPKKAAEILTQSGGDPSKYMDLREAWLNGIVKKFPAAQQYASAWDHRNADLRNVAAKLGGDAGGEQSASAPGWSGPAARTKGIIPPTDPAYARFPAGTVLEQAPDGGVSVVQHPEYSPEAKSTIRDHVLSSDAYKQAKASMSAYQAMIANAGTMTGPSAYSMLDTFARAINPGAVARPTVIETIEKNLGLPAQLVGSLESKFGKGNLPPQVRQQIIDAVVPFAQAHWDQANMLNSANAALAKQHQFDPADVTGPLEGRPQRVIVAVPPVPERHPGSLYVTPKGPLQWTAKGWVQP